MIHKKSLKKCSAQRRPISLGINSSWYQTAGTDRVAEIWPLLPGSCRKLSYFWYADRNAYFSQNIKTLE